MKRFCKISAPVIVASIMIFVSAVPVFAEGLTNAQASDITRELTSNSTSYIKGILAGILKAITGSSTYTGSDNLFSKLSTIANGLTSQNSTGIFQSFKEYFTGAYNGSSSNPSRSSVLGRLAAIDKALYGSHNLEGSDYQGIGWYLYDIDSKMGQSVVDLSISDSYPGNTSSVYPYNSAKRPLRLYYYDPQDGSARFTLSQNPAFLPETFGDWFNLLNDNLLMFSAQLSSPTWNYGVYYNNPDDPLNPTLVTRGVTSVMDVLTRYFEQINNSTFKLQYALANDEDIQIKKDNKDVIEGAVQGFLTPGESSSISASGVVELKGNFDALQNGFGSSAAASDSFSVLSSGSETYSWFSQTTANDLDSVESGSTLRALGSETPALDQYYQDVFFGIHYFD